VAVNLSKIATRAQRDQTFASWWQNLLKIKSNPEIQTGVSFLGKIGPPNPIEMDRVSEQRKAEAETI
jgi:hypothetical protein